MAVSVIILVCVDKGFPTFLVSWTLLTIWLKAVDSFNKSS